jgi:hypothetical protein
MKKFIFLILLSACIDPPQNKIPNPSSSKSTEIGGSESTSGQPVAEDSPVSPGLSGDSVEGPFLGNFSYEVLEGAETLTQKTPGEVSGSGSLRFFESFDRPRLDFNFWLSFALPQVDSKVELIIFAEDDLKQGIEISFGRFPGSKELKVEIQASGESEDISRFFKSFSDFSKMEISIDVHNAHSEFAHFIFWQSLESNVILTDSAAKFDSPGRGFGRRWGFRLYNSQVVSTQRNKPRNNH